MKKRANLLILLFLFSLQHLNGEELSQTVGSASVDATDKSSSGEWKNWVFASTALVALTVGVVLVSLNPGSNAH
jgi:hypothetical protein